MENRSSQPNLDHEGFKLRVVIHSVILDVEHNAQHGYKHEVFDKQKNTNEIERVIGSIDYVIKQNWINCDQTCPDKADHKGFEPPDTSQIVFSKPGI